MISISRQLLRRGSVIVIVLLAGCGESQDSGGAIASAPDVVDPASIPAGVYSVDRNHAYITFSYLHTGYSYPMLRFTGIDGELELSGELMDESEVSIAIDAATIDSKLPRFDTELRSLQYFNVDRYPNITFTTHSYESTGDAIGRLVGFLTVRGRTNSVTLDVNINNAIVHPMTNEPAIGFSATGSLLRSGFGLSRNIPFVADEVFVDIEIEFHQGTSDASSAAARIATETTAAAPAESLVIASN